MKIETSSSSVNIKSNFVWLSYKLAIGVPILFWILIYILNMLPVFFPTYKGKELVNPLFFTPAIIFLVAYAVAGIIKLVFFKIEKERYPNPDKNLFIEIPSDDLLFYEYINNKSYGKFLLLGPVNTTGEPRR